MKIIWVSANKLGYELLKETLRLKEATVKAIITRSNKAKTIMYDGMANKKWYKFSIDVFEIKQLNKEKRLIERLSPDLMVVCGWRQIISKEILNIPSQGVIGFHPTLLPYGGGPAPIINTILKGISESGLTMFYVDRGLDKGDIIAQEKFFITKKDHAYDVYNKVIKAGKKIIKEYLLLVIKRNAPRIAQCDSKVTVFKKLSLKDNKINLEKESLEQVYRKIKALSKPYKGAYIEKDNKRLIIWRAELQDIK